MCLSTSLLKRKPAQGLGDRAREGEALCCNDDEHLVEQQSSQDFDETPLILKFRYFMIFL